MGPLSHSWCSWHLLARGWRGTQWARPSADTSRHHSINPGAPVCSAPPRAGKVGLNLPSGRGQEVGPAALRHPGKLQGCSRTSPQAGMAWAQRGHLMKVRQGPLALLTWPRGWWPHRVCAEVLLGTRSTTRPWSLKSIQTFIVPAQGGREWGTENPMGRRAGLWWEDSVQRLAGPGGWFGSQRSRKSRWAGEAVLEASHPSTRSSLEPRAGHPGPPGLDLCERHPGHWLGSG